MQSAGARRRGWARRIAAAGRASPHGQRRLRGSAPDAPGPAQPPPPAPRRPRTNLCRTDMAPGRPQTREAVEQGNGPKEMHFTRKWLTLLCGTRPGLGGLSELRSTRRPRHDRSPNFLQLRNGIEPDTYNATTKNLYAPKTSRLRVLV